MKHNYFFILFFYCQFAVSTFAQNMNPMNVFGNRAYSMATLDGNVFAGMERTLTKITPQGVFNDMAVLSAGSTTPFTGGFKPIAIHDNFIIYADGDFETQERLWTSANGGTSWSHIQTSGLPSTTIGCFTFDNNGNILAGSVRLTGNTYGGGVYRSTDAGSTWTLIGNQSAVGLDITQVSNIIIKGNMIFVGTFSTGMIFRSSDNGNQWQKLTNGIENYNIISLTINDSGTLFAGTGTGNGTPSGGKGVLRSTDNGETWTQTSLNTHYIFNIMYKNGILLAGSKTDNGGLFRSTDNGTTWQSANTGLYSDLFYGIDIHCLAADSTGNFYCGTLIDGVFKSTDLGLNWFQIGTPIEVKTVAYKENNMMFALGRMGWGYRSTNNGTTWRRIDIATQGLVSALIINSAGTVCAGTNNGLRTSADDGVTWITNDSFPNTPVEALIVGGTTIFAGTLSSGIYFSTNNGTTWTHGDDNEATIWSLAFNYTSNHLFAGRAGVSRSTDNGTTWQVVGLSDYANTEIQISINAEGYIYAGTYDGVYRSLDDGTTWELTGGQGNPKQSGLNNPTNVQVIAHFTDRLFAGTDNGIYASPDGGLTWNRTDTGLVSTNVSSISFNPDGYMIVGAGGGAYKSIHPIAPLTLTPGFQTETLNSFGNVLLGVMKTDSITVTNTGTAILTLNVTRYGNTAFTITPSSETIAPTKTKNFFVTFNPTDTGTVNGTLVFTHNASGSPDSVVLNGKGIIARFVQFTSIVDIGNVILDTSGTGQMSIMNTGNDNLMLSTTSTNNHFIISPMSDTLTGLATHDYTITFAPSTIGNDSGFIVFTHNGPTSPDSVKVKGKGIQISITGSAGTNGSILPSGTVYLNYLADTTFTFTPNTGYHIDSVFVDGVYVDSTTSYTFNNIITNHTIRVVFAINTISITATSGENGTVSPLGNTLVNYGDSITYTISPNTGYRISGVLIDGEIPVGAVDVYTFRNVTTQHTLSVTFALNDTSSYRTFPVNTNLSLKPNKLKVKKGQRAAIPNAVNWRDTVIVKTGGKNGITIGIPQADKNLAKTLGWIRFKSGNDFGKFYTKLQTNILYNAPFDTLRKEGSNKKKRFIKELKPNAESYTNPLAQAFAVFKLNVLSSQRGITPKGLDSLSYVSDGSMWNLMTLPEIINRVDTILTYYKTKTLPNGDTAKVGSQSLGDLQDFFNAVNTAFDTTIALNNGDSVVTGQGLSFGGVINVRGVSFLKKIQGSKVEQIATDYGTENIPLEMLLSQNYPNPFNPTTTLSFVISHSSFVTLKVYNVLGQEVATLLNNESLEEGTYDIQFDARDLSSGMYYYRLTTQTFSETRKMLLVK